MAQQDDLEGLMAHLGEFGRYQWIQFILQIIAAFTAGMHMFSLVTVAPVPEHRCAIPGIEGNGTSFTLNSTMANEWIPHRDDGTFDSCSLIDPVTNKTSICDKWVYDNTYYKSSRAIEWDFVCDRRWMSAISQSSYMFGVFVGAVTLGSLADKYGRKKIFYLSAVLQLILGVAVAFIQEFYTFLLVSFLYGIFGSAGSYITAFVLNMELVGPSKRTACGISFQATFAVGVMMVALWGYLVTNRVILQVIYGLHSLLLIGHWWLLDESPRWLWSQGRIRESVEIVEKGVKINGGVLPDRARFVSRGKVAADRRENSQTSYGVYDMFKTPRLRIMSLNVCLNWFANSLAYYSLSLNTGKLFGNPYLVLFIMALVEIPSYIMSVFLLDKTGRRFLTSSFMLIGGVASIVTAILPTDSPTMSTISTGVVFLGKFFIAGSFAVIYNYSAELFPTVVRNSALGVGSMCARLSATLTPLLTLLDSFDKRIPTVIFASVTLVSGVLTLFLPETLEKPMPQSLEEGEEFGQGDTCFSTGCFGRKSIPIPNKDSSYNSLLQT